MTAELPLPAPKYTLARPPLLTPESAAAANASSSDNNNNGSSSPVTATTASGASFYLSPRAVSALETLDQRAREPSVLYGRDVIQVPLRLAEADGAYVNLVLSHREFDRMAVHIPQYDEMAPRALLEEITRLLQEEERAQKRKQSLAGGGGDAAAGDSAAAFQARVMELEFERKRLNTKLQAARALQTRCVMLYDGRGCGGDGGDTNSGGGRSVTDENTTLRMNVRELESLAVELEKARLQNELLREQAVRAATEVARVKRLAAGAQAHVQQVAAELQQLRAQVATEREALSLAAAEAMARVTQDVQRREKLLQESYLEEKAERQLIAEKFYELSGRIRVFCRVRPPSVRGAAQALLRPKPNSVLVERGGAKEFAFDHVFGPEATQRAVYAQVEPLVVSFADGYNACIMAYGQTGTGKTFTMMGSRHDPESAGVIPRALQQVFAVVGARQLTYSDTLAVSMVEIYNDQVLDLLNEENGRGAAVKNESDITARSVTRWAHVDEVLTEGNANRNIAATSMNLESSRSHALVFLHLTSQHRETLETKRSTLCLVDLAGSERIARSQVEGERLKETQHINKSLAALGDVVFALQHKAKHTPYRNSKLTYMLREMLSGQAKTLLMLQLSPDEPDVDETTCSLQFGARVSQVQMGAVRQSVESGELFKLKDEARALETRLKASDARLAEWKDECRYKSEQLTEARERAKDLERQLRLQSDEVASLYDNMDRNGASEMPASPSSGFHARTAPSSPTQSVKSTRSTTSSASLPVTPSSSSSSSISRLAARKSLGASMRQTVANDTVLDTETRRKSLSTLPTRSSPSTLSARSIRASREAPPSLPSRKPLTSSSSSATATTSSSVPQSPATSRIARPRTSLGASSSAAGSSSTTTTTGASGTPRTPLRRASSLASSAGPSSSSSSAGTPRAAATPTSRAESRRPLSRSSSGVRSTGSSSTTTTTSRSILAAPSSASSRR